MTYWRRLMGPIVFLACIGWTSGEPEPYLRAVDDEAGGRVLQIASRTLGFAREGWSERHLARGFALGQQDVLQGNSKEARYRGLSSLRGRRLWGQGPQKEGRPFQRSIRNATFLGPLHGVGFPTGSHPL